VDGRTSGRCCGSAGSCETVVGASTSNLLDLAPCLVGAGLHVIFPGFGVIDWFAVLVSTVAFIAMLRWKWEIVPVILCSGVAGLIFKGM
jgi:hypothetical protein